MRNWIVNASPLILLCKVNQQLLLTQLCDNLIVPQAVVDEINSGPSDDPARNWLRSHPIPVHRVTPHPTIIAWDLGAGETAVLSYALSHPEWRIVVDDGAARRCAKTFTIPLMGTLGVILMAKREELIDAAVPILKNLIRNDYRINERVIREALAQTTGESWS